MTKFRQNHNRQGRKGNNFMIRIGMFAILLVGGLLFGFINIQDIIGTSIDSSSHNEHESFTRQSGYIAPNLDRSFLPSVTGKNQLVHHKYYSLSYNEKHEIPEWVAYNLTRKSLQAPNVSRAKRFNSDPDVKSKSAKHNDYSHSGYTRGHMAPAGDMAFNKDAMQETFFMSNMAPQIRPFNNGIWKELEEQVRDWAYNKEELIVISGPIMNGIKEHIGKNKVGVPKSFYKILVDKEGNKDNAIGFIIPHDVSEKRLQEYAVWKFDNKRYRLRVEKWNNE